MAKKEIHEKILEGIKDEDEAIGYWDELLGVGKEEFPAEVKRMLLDAKSDELRHHKELKELLKDYDMKDSVNDESGFACPDCKKPMGNGNTLATHLMVQHKYSFGQAKLERDKQRRSLNRNDDTCESCGEKVAFDSSFCRSCGAALSDQVAILDGVVKKIYEWWQELKDPDKKRIMKDIDIKNTDLHFTRWSKTDTDKLVLYFQKNLAELM